MGEAAADQPGGPARPPGGSADHTTPDAAGDPEINTTTTGIPTPGAAPGAVAHTTPAPETAETTAPPGIFAITPPAGHPADHTRQAGDPAATTETTAMTDADPVTAAADGTATDGTTAHDDPTHGTTTDDTDTGATPTGAATTRAPGSDPAADDLDTRRRNLFRGLVDRAAAAEVSQDRMRHLLDAVLSVASDLSLPAVLRRIVTAGCELAGARYGALGVLGQDGAFEALTHAGLDDRTGREIGALPVGKGILGLVIERPEPLRVPDLTGHEAAAGFPENHPRMGSFLGVPIRVRGEVFGNLYLTEKVGGRGFTQEDEDVVVALAAAAGMAIENARHYDRSIRRERWLRATTEVTAVLRTNVCDAEGLDLMVRRAREVAGAVLAFVAVPAGPEHLEVRAVDGTLSTELAGSRMAAGDSITGDVFSTGRARVLGEVAQATLTRSVATFHQLPEGISGLGPAVFVPMSTGSRASGVLMLAREHGGTRFDDEDVRMVTDFATHAALAIEFAYAQQDRQRLALYEERDRIARDLHDLVIQRLFAIGLGLQGLRRSPHNPDAGERLGGFVAEIDQTIREIRRSIFSLQQPANGPYSLRGEILRAISEATVTLGFEPTVRLEGPLDSVVPADVALDLMATLREALSNVVRHAGASGVALTVAVDRHATRLRLLVRDDGRGLPADITHRGGLSNMVQRARRWEGDCVIDSPAVGGTRVDWDVPLRRPAPTGRDQDARGQEARG
ncbi:GAF domain-containing protein [Actinokineospora auranticolor]|uniref:GAF domain-containing protein n=1 Tax=Actinokineospora auranticolor TaxID=155976 RepID=A0A2S6GBQ5_9PSEU|nr:GAF domain-containing protein [Actinokineospora auranticolor]PPK61471.1 GAF domain-containing protein [Actinokineospora auranticolor]